MQTLQLAEIVIGSIISLGILIAGAGYGYGQYYQGKKKLAKDDVELFNEQLEAFKKIIESQKEDFIQYQKKRDSELQILREDIKKHTQEIGRLQGINEEKEKKIADLNAILQNRDPALSEYLKYARESITEFKEGMKGIFERLEIIKQDLKDEK